MVLFTSQWGNPLAFLSAVFTSFGNFPSVA
jgi:hypothetical protein